MDTTPIELMLSVAGLFLACAALGITAFPSDHLSKGKLRYIRIVFGWILVIGGLTGFFDVVSIIVTGKSQQTTRDWFATNKNSSPILYQPTPSPKLPKNNSTTYCQAVSIWFLNSEPEFNIYPNIKEGDAFKPKLEMKFYVSCINKTKEERYLTFLPSVPDAKLPKNWQIQVLGLEPISGAETVLSGAKILVAPQKHFLFYAHLTISTEDMRSPDFYESFKKLSETINFALIVKTDEGETCLASQEVSIKKGFFSNFKSNWNEITQSWGD